MRVQDAPGNSNRGKSRHFTSRSTHHAEQFCAGSAYVYDLGSVTPTVPVVTLNNPEPLFNDLFGSSVAISGTHVVVGERGFGTDTIQVERVYVYDLSSGTSPVPVATLYNPNPAVDQWFGCSVAISGMRVVVGSPYDGTGAIHAGSAYVFDLSSGTPTLLSATLNNPNPAEFDWFGFSVAISGIRVVVGAPYADQVNEIDAGGVYVYDLNGGTPTVPLAELNIPGSTAFASFGYSVAISGTLVVAGAPYEATGDVLETGGAYVFDIGSGTPTEPVATLNSPSPSAEDWFGYSVATSGSLVVVGSPRDQSGALSAGSAYVYDLGSDTPAVPIAALVNPDPEANDLFGWSVAISGTHVVVGVPYDNSGESEAGSAYVYDLSSETPTVPVATLNNPDPEEGDHFGFSVAISGTRVVVGTPRDRHFHSVGSTSEAGSAFVYDLSSGTPTVPELKLQAPFASHSAHFGWSVAISGTRLVVGTPQDDTGATDSGRAYVYDLDVNPAIVPVASLINPSPAVNDRFGSAVAISGSRVVVGAAGDDTGATNAGSAYVYDLNPSFF